MLRKVASRRAVLLAASLALLAAGAAGAQPKERKPDLADAVAGTYAGDVISDSKGSSRSGVTLTVTRTGPNTVTVTSDYRRLPQIVVPLTSAMNTIQQARGDSVFLYDRGKKQLDVSFNMEVSWSGFRQ
ncbi:MULTISPECIES: hypothetical protein [unclassified Phenylobacterium]|uniref:hypothetical protein n=1 Tax=unclassified Phenylobacterium TaxID=2640670 RepID=UPI00083B3299|nr:MULTISPECIES: hypothetical protein [unclassified Phenylobacterium]